MKENEKTSIAKVLLSVLLCLVMATSVVVPTMAASTPQWIANALTVLDLDGWDDSWKYDTVNFVKDVTSQTKPQANKTDIINASLSTMNAEEKEYALQLVDNGAVLLLQNGTDEFTSYDVASEMSIDMNTVKLVDTLDETLTLGFVITKQNQDFMILPVFAYVLNETNEESITPLEQSLIELRETEPYVNPFDFYSAIVQNQTNSSVTTTNVENAVLQADPTTPSNSYWSPYGYGYLFGNYKASNNPTVWGSAPTSDYIKVATIEFNVYIVSEGVVNGYNQDRFYTRFRLGGNSDYHISSFTIGFGSISGAYVNDYLDVPSNYGETTISMGTSYGSNGTTSTSTIAYKFNPDKCCITPITPDINSKYSWRCAPQSAVDNGVWAVQPYIVTRTTNNVTATVYPTLYELKVNSGVHEFANLSSTLVFKQSYKNHAHVN
ncbi:MAG: hypothetical protein LBJ12_06370 [Oscillospiraceae bacterium]|nr:hypothetical protein [Oscillospiraceae bacterium]